MYTSSSLTDTSVENLRMLSDSKVLPLEEPDSNPLVGIGFSRCNRLMFLYEGVDGLYF